MSLLTGLQIFELMNGIRDGLIVESIPPSWVGGHAPAPSGTIIMDADPIQNKKKNEKSRRNRQKAAVLPLWLGKGGWLAALIGLLVAAGLTVGLFALRDGRRDDPGDTESESITETFEDLSGFDAADYLLSQLVIPDEGAELGLTTHTDIRRVTEQEGVTVGFREQHKGTLVLDGQKFRMTRTPYELDEEVYLYDGSMLYISTLEGQTKSPMDGTELGVLLAHIRDEQGLPEETKTFTASELFETAQVNPPSAAGTVSVVCTGLKRTAIKDLVPILRPVLESLGLVSGYTLDSAGNLIRDNETADGQTRILLFALAKGNLTVTLTATADGVLKRLDTSAELEAEIEGINLEYEINGWAEFRFAVNSVKPTVSMGQYKQLHWRTVFDCENAESLGLIPDGEGVYHITEVNSETWDKQVRYVLDNPEEFMGKTFHVVGYIWGAGGQWPDNKYANSIYSAKAGYAPLILTAEQYEATRNAYYNGPNKVRCEIYATVAIDYISIDKKTGTVFAVERISFP